ncbi:MAG: hypothetical protein CM15mP49_34930 [Actinomycetota bacterium]|nr:MAG: hypothetical protein CM15mP49_34930 [Actinomycetota bacterium]
MESLSHCFQLAAMLTGPDRTEDLQSIEVPTLVIHGAKDTLVQVDGGQALRRRSIILV